MAARTSWQTNRIPNNADAVQGQRRHDDSWVEISSQPSSSSLSSIGDDIVTSGLQVGVGRKPYGNSHHRPPSNEASGPRSESSSHDEYEETSDEDLLLASSTEYLASHNHASLASPRHRDYNSNLDMTDSDDGDDGDDDENATALGIGRGAAPHSPLGFRPQPNAFSHPPRHPTLQSSSRRSRNATSAGPAPAPHPHSAFSRRSLHGSRPQHPTSASQTDFMMPSCAAVDNDAALRASLTTLLSCAAGLRKDDTTRSAALRAAAIPPSQQPMELRLVPESELMTAEPVHAVTIPPQHQRSRNKTNSADKSKHSAAMTAMGGVRSSQRAAKKNRIDEPTFAMVSPTLLTWVVSAGLVVLVGFGAGYVIGREVGRQEAMAGMNISSVAGEGAAGCGREAIRGSGGTALKRLRWGASFGKSIVT